MDLLPLRLPHAALLRVRILLQHIRQVLQNKPAGYYEEVILAGKVIEDTWLEIDEAVYEELRAKYEWQQRAIAHANGIPFQLGPQNCC